MNRPSTGQLYCRIIWVICWIYYNYLIISIAPFNEKLDALARFASSVASNRGAASQESIEAFYNAGYTKGNLADAILVIGEITITNYFHRTTEVPVDFPVAQSLELATV